MMQLGDDTLIEIGTFLARRWSGRPDCTIEFSERNEARTGLRDGRITMPSVSRLRGDGFERYRQFRTAIWYEAMRLRLCGKILSSDHAYGFVLNALETRRIELLGRRAWRGMDEELVFYYAYRWIYRPQLHAVYGRARIAEGFYQRFLFGDTKGEIAANHLERIGRAAGLAHETLDESVRDGHGTDWLEKRIPDIMALLGIDSLLTVPVAVPWTKPDMPLTQEELLRSLVRVSDSRRGELGRLDPRAALRGERVMDEYRALLDEDRRGRGATPGADAIGVRSPPRTDVDETAIYDVDLIHGLKTRFKDWRSGWREEHLTSGDEFDEESYIDGQDPFVTDVKRTVRTEITMLLDHSSSIHGDQLEYKKATLALCEVLSYLKVRFAVYAFSTVDKAVVCWLVKSDMQKWNSACAKRLAQIVANGSTPLADVYHTMQPVLQSGRPEIFLTLTDGEPSDPEAVRLAIKSIKSLDIRPVALGLGPDTVRATAIASNLRGLGYERTLAVSRLGDIPNKVIGILGEG